MATRTSAPAVDATIEIRATPRVVLDAFFNAASLSAWLRTVRSVTIPQALGPYAVEWPTSQERDDVLGRLGGVLRGTVLQVEPTRGFSLTDVFWLPPFGHPVGPMALEVTCRLGVTADAEPATLLRVTQSGFEESVRWRRYYEVAQAEWQASLGSLQALLEKQS
jgi:uncharacterized protein YndB with AHSA1/START domain